MSWKDILKKDSMLSGKEYFDGEFTEKETDYPKEIQLKGEVFEKDGVVLVDSEDILIRSMIYRKSEGSKSKLNLDTVELTLKDAESLAFDVNNMGGGLSDFEQDEIVRRQESENLRTLIEGMEKDWRLFSRAEGFKQPHNTRNRWWRRK